MSKPIARIVEVSRGDAAAFAGMLLADLGAEVIKIEPPGGDVLRREESAQPQELSFLFLNRRKRSVILDLRRLVGRDALRSIVRRADAVIEDLGRYRARQLGLSYRGLRGDRNDFTMVSISPFGHSGPWSDWDGPEIVVQATGGIVAGTGYEDGEPLKLPGYVASYIAGLNGATAALVGIYGVRSGLEKGVHFDVSAQEAFSAHWARHISQYIYAGMRTRRPPRGMGLQGFPHTAKASDGLVFILALRADWESLAFFLGLEKFANHEWSDPAARVERWSEIEPAFCASLASKGRYEWTAAAAERGYTFAPVDDPLSVLSSPQLEARGFFSDATLDSGEIVRCPGLPFKLDAGLRPNRVPELGEDTEAVLEEAGVDMASIARLKEAGAFGGPARKRKK